MLSFLFLFFFFFFNDTATTEIYTLSLHDARPIWLDRVISGSETWSLPSMPAMKLKLPKLNSLLGMKVTALMLNGAIKLVDGLILMTPPTWRQLSVFFYRQYYLWGRSSDHKRDGSTRRGNKTQDLAMFGPSGR